MNAPIEPAALAPARAPFGQSTMLPAAAYVSADVLAWEQEHFFAGSWVCAGRADRLDRSGDQAAVAVGAETVLLVRGADGTLRAFANVCRHRAHELLGSGETAQRPLIRCPYHAWTYNLDGTLRAAPRSGLDAPPAACGDAALGLVPVALAEWHGWVFLNVSGGARPFAAHVDDLEEIVAPYEPGRLTVVAAHEYELAANWKLAIENYHECYHCPSIHPELCRVSPHESGSNYAPRGAWAGGFMELAPHADTMSLTGESRGVVLRGLDEKQRRHVVYVGVFPNFLVSLHPDYVMTHRIEPLAPGRSRVECAWLFPPEVGELPDFDPGYATDFWDVTNRQDWAAVESVQRGVASRSYRPGPLSVQEDALYNFVTLVARGYAGETAT